MAARAPLTDILPAAPGDHGAALGFALAWMLAEKNDGLIIWALPDAAMMEDGVPHAEGLAQFGLPLDDFLVVRTRTVTDALWAAEQALATPEARVLVSIPGGGKALGLTPARRLALRAEGARTRCVLLRMDKDTASPAWTRWRISAAQSEGERFGMATPELGAPAFSVRIERNRAGPAGLSWRVSWVAHTHDLKENPFHDVRSVNAPACFPGALVEGPLDGPAPREPFRGSPETQRAGAQNSCAA